MLTIASFIEMVEESSPGQPGGRPSNEARENCPGEEEQGSTGTLRLEDVSKVFIRIIAILISLLNLIATLKYNSAICQ